MDPQVQATLVGGVIAAGAGFVAWALGAATSAWLARKQREHERREKRYDDVKSAYVQFYSTMRQIVEKAELDDYHEGGTYADRNPYLDPISHLLAGTDAETALAHLRLFADQPLYSAGREWLDAYYARFWDEGRKKSSGDTRAAEDRFVTEGKRALGVTT